MSHSLNHSLTQSLTQSITNSITHSLNHLLNQSLNYSINHSITQLLNNSITQLLTQPLNHLLNYSLNHSLSHSIAQSLTHSNTHSLNQSLTHSLTHSIIGNPHTGTSCGLLWIGARAWGCQLVSENVLSRFPPYRKNSVQIVVWGWSGGHIPHFHSSLKTVRWLVTRPGIGGWGCKNFRSGGWSVNQRSERVDFVSTIRLKTLDALW